MLALAALKLLAGGWAVELRATVSVDASGSGNWGRGACIGPRCPGVEVARTKGPLEGVGLLPLGPRPPWPLACPWP